MTLPAIFKIKTVFFLFLFFSLFFLLAPGVKAQSGTGPGTSVGTSGIINAEHAFEQYYFQKPLVNYQNDLYGGETTDLNQDRFGFSLLNNSGIAGLSTILMGTLPETTRTTGYYNPGAFGTASNLVAGLVNNPPVSTTEYIADLGSSLGIIQPAYAQQGTGWKTLQPVLNIWKVFRNLSYLIFVLIFVVIGFMIMFRAKINPQTVISVESAIPNLIITLIVITFSYAIASFMIDLIWVGIYLVLNVFSAYGIAATGATKATVENSLMTKSVIGLAYGDIWSSLSGGGIVSAAAGAVGDLTKDLLFGQGTVGGNITGMITSGFAFLIISIALVFSMFKLFFQLLMSYIGLILSVIFAPFQLIGNALPGSNSLSTWLKGMLANTLVFPATVIMFLLAGALTGSKDWGAGADVGYTGNASMGVPLLGGGNVDAIKGLIGLGMLMMAPRVVDMIKAALKIEKGAGGMAGAAAPLVSVLGLPGQALQQSIMLLQARSYIKPNIPQEKGPLPNINRSEPETTV